MAVHSVNYDLAKPGRDYQQLYTAIKRYTHCHILESTWLIETTENPTQVTKKLSAHIDQNDRLLVTQLSGEWAANRDYPCIDWLKKRFP